MKFSFKKISAIGASVLMAGLTMGIAAAASYPAPFVSQGVADVAIVYGSGAGVSATDQVQSGLIQSSLADSVTGNTIITDGDSFLLEKTSTKFHLGDYAGDVVSTTVDDDQLPTLLADGKFVDNDNDEFDYTQKITLNNDSLRTSLFDDNDYKQDEPTVGIRIANNANILNYTLDFTDEPLFNDLSTSDLPFLGKSYYVLSVGSSNNSITLLDSAEDTVLAEGETITIGGKSASIEYIGTSEVKLNIDSEVTNSLSESETYKLKDGSYIGIKDIMYDSKDTGVSKVEFSIGSGKLVLTNSSDVELNEETVSDLGVTITSNSAGTKLSSIVLQWDAENDLFVTEDSQATLPGFESIKFSFGGLVYPTEEELEVEADGDNSIVLKDFPLSDTSIDLNVAYFNGTAYTMVGKDSDNLLRTSGSSNLIFDGDTDDLFIVSYSESKDFESYAVKVINFKNESSTQKATFQYKKDGVWTTFKTDAQPGDTVSIGSVDMTVVALNKDAKTASLSIGSGMSFHTIFSKEGMRVDMPWLNETAVNTTTTYADNATACTGEIASLGVGQLGYNQAITYNATSGTETTTTCTSYPATYTLNFTEENKDGTLGAGDKITLTLSDDANNEASVETVTGYDSGRNEIGSTDVYRSFTYSALATEILEDQSADQESAKLIYHGEEVLSKVYLSSADAVTTNGALGDVLVTDTEISNVSSKNLVIVGGSCINSAAAHVLGGAYCGTAFTAATGVGSGEFLIKGFPDAYTTGKLALVVAGYNAVDTANAATYLTMKDVDTSKAYKGSSGTEATLIVA